MTKAEQKRMDDLESGLRQARSMRWPEYNMPAPLTEVEIRAALVDGGIKHGVQPQKVAFGWFANSHTGRVTYGCSDGFNHNSEGDYTTTQGCGRMFATEADAWRAVRYLMTERFSKELATIDQKLADAQDFRP